MWRRSHEPYIPGFWTLRTWHLKNPPETKILAALLLHGGTLCMAGPFMQVLSVSESFGMDQRLPH